MIQSRQKSLFSLIHRFRSAHVSSVIRLHDVAQLIYETIVRDTDLWTALVRSSDDDDSLKAAKETIPFSDVVSYVVQFRPDGSNDICWRHILVHLILAPSCDADRACNSDLIDSLQEVR